ncbi:MAG: 4-hydroxy-tetrahydrodipicolinate synthase [Rickettsiales bacterium]|jgi:4-hydroxy-tetrahydrodipicolinate synthase|nr:4-hydroxy-tetrahydrodipicolinate synthase [Rickettsiales bacterium]
MFQGVYTALVTPFAGGNVDEKAFQNLVEWQITEGIHGLVPCGTTGESPTLSHEEHNRVIALCVEVAKGRVPVMAGTGSNSTEEAIMLTKHAKEAGASGALIVAPYYNKPTQAGLYAHYKAIHDAVDIPIVIYNIPGRSGINITDETLAKLAELPRIVGLKDATGDLARPYTLRAKLKKNIDLLSGEDMTAVAFNASGGVGCISVSSNIAPRACAEVQNACLKGDYVGALKLHDPLVTLHDVMFIETNPVPVKFALSLMGRCKPDLRLPLAPLSEASQKAMSEVLKNLRLI